MRDGRRCNAAHIGRFCPLRRNTMNTTSRRALLAGAPAAAAAVLAGGTITSALAMAPLKAAGLDWPAIVLRAEAIADRLQKYYGQDWTDADQEAAAAMLRYCRDREAGLPDDETAWKATLEFFWDYGQSLDYVVYGDPASMIAKSAARSPRGRPAWQAELEPIFGLIEKHTAACDAARAISDVQSTMSPRNPRYEATQGRFSEAIEREREVLVALLSCQRTTLAGVVAVLEHAGRADWAHAGDSEETVLIDAQKREMEQAKAFPTHLAAALCNIIGRGQA
jgi:hypothetical protein